MREIEGAMLSGGGGGRGPPAIPRDNGGRHKARPLVSFGARDNETLGGLIRRGSRPPLSLSALPR